jgi:hypothetical protein
MVKQDGQDKKPSNESDAMATRSPLVGDAEAADRPMLDYESPSSRGRFTPSWLILFAVAVCLALFATYRLLAPTVDSIAGGTRGYIGRIPWGILHYRTVDYYWRPGPGFSVKNYTVEKWDPPRVALTALVVVLVWIAIFVIRPRRTRSKRIHFGLIRTESIGKTKEGV